MFPIACVQPRAQVKTEQEIRRSGGQKVRRTLWFLIEDSVSYSELAKLNKHDPKYS
jgi:hypothetical protein